MNCPNCDYDIPTVTLKIVANRDGEMKRYTEGPDGRQVFCGNLYDGDRTLRLEVPRVVAFE